MNIREFCNGIHLQKEAAELVHAYSADSNTYKEVKDCFYNDYEAFTRMIAEQKDAAAWFLYYFVHFSCEAHEEYVKRGLSDQLYWDTFSDLTIWCENCRRDYGVTGLMEYDWLWRHVKLRLFRLGRLQFELYNAPHGIEVPGISIAAGEMLLNVHIPQGSPADPAACEEAFRLARAMFPEYHYFHCESWMLYPGLAAVMKETANTILFQKRFLIYETEEEEREAEKRIFQKVLDNPEDYPADTPFRQRVRTWLIQGHKLGNASGIFYME